MPITHEEPLIRRFLFLLYLNVLSCIFQRTFYLSPPPPMGTTHHLYTPLAHLLEAIPYHLAIILHPMPYDSSKVTVG